MDPIDAELARKVLSCTIYGRNCGPVPINV